MVKLRPSSEMVKSVSRIPATSTRTIMALSVSYTSVGGRQAWGRALIRQRDVSNGEFWKSSETCQTRRNESDETKISSIVSTPLELVPAQLFF